MRRSELSVVNSEWGVMFFISSFSFVIKYFFTSDINTDDHRDNYNNLYYKENYIKS